MVDPGGYLGPDPVMATALGLLGNQQACLGVWKLQSPGFGLAGYRSGKQGHVVNLN